MKYVIQTEAQLKNFAEADVLTGLAVAEKGENKWVVVYEVGSKLWGFMSETKRDEIRFYRSYKSAIDAVNRILGHQEWYEFIQPNGPLQEHINNAFA